MKFLVILGAILAVTSAAQIHDALLAKWAPFAVADSFYKIPRTISELQSDNITWVKVYNNTEDPFSVYCENNNARYCVLFDKNGFIAGEEYSITDVDIVNSTGSYNFANVPSFRRTTKFGRQVWTGTAFFVSPAVLNSGGRTNLLDGTIVELWIQRGATYNSSVQIPLDRTALETETNYLLCNCLPGMGIHYYTEMHPTGSCDKFDPWFMLYNNQTFVGLGFQSFGKPEKLGTRHYSEDVPRQAIDLVVPNAPDCFLKMFDDFGPISLHTFFVSDPLKKITCPAATPAKTQA